MEFDFETLVERSGANLKLMMTPTEVVKAGNISLDGAEPDFKSAPVIEEAVIRFAKNGLYGFTLPDEAYKSAVTKWMQMSRKIQIKPEWIVTTLGTIYSLATTIRLVCTDPDDGIIVTTPVYNRYRQAADRLNKKTVECPLLYDSVNGSYQMILKQSSQLWQIQIISCLCFAILITRLVRSGKKKIWCVWQS